jgi:ubiquinone/menaquinone biosynthesis C-methylase UbiE
MKKEDQKKVDLKSRMVSFYNHSAAYRDLLSDRERYRIGTAQEHYASLVKELGLATAEGVVLDLGCGTGDTTRRLQAVGCKAIGVDVSLLLLRGTRASSPETSPVFVVADITRLPFRSGSANCVALHNVIEHVPNVDELLSEILRVLTPNGHAIVSPNLLTPVKPVRHILGVEGFSTKFYGSYLRAAWAIVANMFAIFRKLMASRPNFLYRTPILDDFQCPDDDAVYLSNPIDLYKWFASHGCAVTYLQFMPNHNRLTGRIKAQLWKWLPWFDKGFCLLAVVVSHLE